MEEARGSSPRSSTLQLQALAEAHASAGCFFGGLVAGEGCFIITRKSTPYADGAVRPRFVFGLEMAERDAALVRGLRDFLGVGSIRRASPRKAHHLPSISLTINSLRQHHAATIPFAETFLLPSQKREQFEVWRDAMAAHEATYPNRWGKGPSACSVPDCGKPVRGRGLCRSHYYEATGY